MNLMTNLHMKIFFLGWDNMGGIRIPIPSENLGFAYPVCKKRISIPSENLGLPNPVCKNILSR